MPTQFSPRVESASSDNSHFAVTIFCDGACSGNPGAGGWGAIVEHDGAQREYSGGARHTTNNQMELQALIEGLKAIPAEVSRHEKIKIVTDSEYLSKGVTQWMKGWIKNGWQTAARKPVKNQELWREINLLLLGREYSFEWVRGHSGHAENERCDELARAAIQKLKSQPK
jgi:ribonuclease HI